MRTLLIASLVVAACSKPSAAPAPAPASAPGGTASRIVTDTRIQTVATVERIYPKTGAQALKDFVTDALPDETGGECQLTRTTGNGALTAIASYPSRAAAKSNVVVTFDSAGHVVRYAESRGIPPVFRGKMEQVDSVRRAFEADHRSTTISFDYGADRAMAMNRGAGKPIVAITSAVRDMEKLENLQQPAARMERMRKLCGV